MLRRLLPLTLLVLSACSGATPLSEPDAATEDVAAPQVTITAAIASASLADDCPAERGSGLADCARLAGDSGAFDSACGFCRQTGLQLTFAVTATDGSASGAPANAVQVTGVRLLDAPTGAGLGALTPREPQRWEGTQYVAWDGVLRGYGESRVSYKLSAPNWVAIGGGNTWSTYGRAFRLEVTVVVRGQTFVLRSGELMRAPEVVT
jgi:hypothetical protein